MNAPVKGWNLHSVVQIVEEQSAPLLPGSGKSSDAVRKARTALAVLQTTQAFAKADGEIEEVFSGEKHGDKMRKGAEVWLLHQSNLARKRLLEASVNAIVHVGTMPEDFLLDLEDLSKDVPEVEIVRIMAETPRTDLHHLRQLADALGFLIIPFAVLKEESYADEEEPLKDAIRTFDAALSPHCQVYAIAPPDFYDLTKHLELADQDLSLYVPKEHAAKFEGIQMCLSLIGKAMKEQKRQLALEMKRREELRRMEPMLFAIPNGVDVARGSSRALIGPVWGPDMTEIMPDAFKLTDHRTQRGLLAKAASKFRLAAPPDHYRVWVDYAPMPTGKDLEREFPTIHRPDDIPKELPDASWGKEDAPVVGYKVFCLESGRNGESIGSITKRMALRGYRLASLRETYALLKTSAKLPKLEIVRPADLSYRRNDGYLCGVAAGFGRNTKGRVLHLGVWQNLSWFWNDTRDIPDWCVALVRQDS